MEVARQSKTGLDITGEAEVIAYAVTSAEAREYIARVDLGDAAGPIVGEGTYTLSVYINGVVLSPSSDVTVTSGTAKTLLVSRPLPLEPGDAISVRVTGRPDDSSVNTLATLRDVTPIRLDEVAGAGPIPVDHDYGGRDRLRFVTAAGAGIVGADVVAYLAGDYNAGQRGPDFVQGRSTTRTDGRWATPAYLYAGDYVLVFGKPGAYQPSPVRLSVG